MKLSWKDAVTTLLAVATAGLGYARLHGWQSWLTGPRWGVLTLGAIGLAMCIVGSQNVQAGGFWLMSLSVLGGLSLVLLLVGLITGHAIFFYALALDVLALWLFSTLRHVLAAT